MMPGNGFQREGRGQSWSHGVTLLTHPYMEGTWMVTIRGSGWRVLAPPSMAMPKVAALFVTRTRVDVGSRSPGCGVEGRERVRGRTSEWSVLGDGKDEWP